MKDHGAHVSKTAVDDAVDSFLQKMRHQGVGKPSSLEPQSPKPPWRLVRSWLPQSFA